MQTKWPSTRNMQKKTQNYRTAHVCTSLCTIHNTAQYSCDNLFHLVLQTIIIHLRQRLSVCLCARLVKNACVDLDEMLRVDRCLGTDELLTFEPDPDHSPDAGTGFLSPIAYALQRSTWNFITSGKSHAHTSIGGPSKQQHVVLRRRKTIV